PRLRAANSVSMNRPISAVSRRSRTDCRYPRYARENSIGSGLKSRSILFDGDWIGNVISLTPLGICTINFKYQLHGAQCIVRIAGTHRRIIQDAVDECGDLSVPRRISVVARYLLSGIALII